MDAVSKVDKVDIYFAMLGSGSDLYTQRNQGRTSSGDFFYGKDIQLYGGQGAYDCWKAHRKQAYSTDRDPFIESVISRVPMGQRENPFVGRCVNQGQ
jgi:hypothetical protein